MNEELVDAMNKVLGDTFLTYFKAQSGHWNVETRSFYADHTFLESIYSEIYENMNNTIFICILFFFDSLYSYISFAINACIFLINIKREIISFFYIN